MKAIFTIFCTLLSAGIIWGQQSFNEMRPVCNQQQVNHYSQSQFSQIEHSKDYGDILWSEDFGGGMIPTGWVTVDNMTLNHVWKWSNDTIPGSTGQYSGGTIAFHSSTVNNGYMLLPGDEYNTPGTTSTFVDMDAYITTAPINCDTASSVMLKFEQYFRYCCGGDQILQVSVSTDNVNWTDYDVSRELSSNITSDNPDIVMINITSIAAFQSTVYIKFYMGGVSHYYWAVDDIALVVAPDNDIRIDKTYLSNVGIISGSYEYLGYYSSVPTNQITPLSIMADIWNYGNSTQHDVTFNATVTNSLGVDVYNQNNMINSILPDSIEFLEIPVFFTPFQADSFVINFNSSQNETDEIPENNTSASINYKINSDKVYARDYVRNSNTSVYNYTGGADGDFIGCTYYINTIDTVESISVFIDDNTDAGTTIIAQLYEKGSSSPTLIIESVEHIIQMSELGSWLTLPLISISAGDNVLDPQTNYYAGVECYSNGNNIYLGADSEGPHLLHLASNLRLGATWYWIHTLPLVRLNLSGTDVLPFITSTPIYDIDFLDAYSYTVTTFDPQGLPVTLSATASSPDISMQAVDNGDGTMSISTPVISTTSFGDDDFTISITVDNGIASNYQQFMVQVANVFQVEDISKTETLIFPNPVKHTLYCRNPENAIIQIYSLTGSLVYLNKSAGSNKSIDMSLFNEGTYFIKIIDGNNVVINKFAHIK